MTLAFAQIVIAIFRGIFRFQEVMTPPGPKKDRLRRFRQRMEETEQAKREALSRIANGDIRHGMEPLERMAERNGDTKMAAMLREGRLEQEATFSEVDTLKRISQEAADNDAAIAGFRAYLQEHPQSHLAWSWLAGRLEKAGNYPDALTAYEESERLLKPESAGVLSAQNKIAVLYAKMGNYEELERRFQELTGSKGDTFISLAWACWGDMRSLQGDVAGARAAWKRARRRDKTGALRKYVQKRLSGEAFTPFG